MLKNVLLLALAVSLWASCKKREESPAQGQEEAVAAAPAQPTPEPGTPPPTPESAEKDTAAAPAAPPTGAGGQATGIAACDEYLDKYQACLEAKVPESARAAMKDAFQAQRDAWRQSAAAAKDNDAMREQLAKNCTEALAAARAPMQQYGCEW